MTDRWTSEAAIWIQAIDDARPDPESGHDPVWLAARGREALDAMIYEPRSSLIGEASDEDFTEYARLITSNRDTEQD